MLRSRDWGVLAGLIAITALAAVTGGLASVNAREFYAQLLQPVWAPPGWVFGPIWGVLYTLMIAGAWQVYRVRGFEGARPLLLLYLIQLSANALWTWLFFAWRLGAVALAEVILLWFLVGLTTFTFWSVRRSAGALLLPYWIWVTFATALTQAMWRLNPALLG
jgi:tryptophan-rich sensory protein